MKKILGIIVSVMMVSCSSSVGKYIYCEPTGDYVTIHTEQDCKNIKHGIARFSLEKQKGSGTEDMLFCHECINDNQYEQIISVLNNIQE